MNIKYLREYRHKNLIVLFKIYKFKNVLFTVMKYIIVTLTQIIIISFKFAENYIFCVYSQINMLYIFIILRSLISTDASRNEISIRVYYCTYQSQLL